MTKIIGLFEDEQDLACAVKGLYNRGFNQEEIEVINPNPFVQSRMVHKQARRTITGASPNFIGDVTATSNSPAKAKAGSSIVDPTGRLTTMGIPEAEACFFAVNVERGHRLIIVETEIERAHVARQIFGQANARVSSGYD